MRRATAGVALALLLAVIIYGHRACVEMAWRGPVATVHGTLHPPSIDGPWWVLRATPDPATGAADTRARALAAAAALGLVPAGEPVTGRAGRPPVPSVVRLSGAGYALLVERAAHAARLYDPARGDVVLLSRDLKPYLDREVQPLAPVGTVGR